MQVNKAFLTNCHSLFKLLHMLQHQLHDPSLQDLVLRIENLRNVLKTGNFPQLNTTEVLKDTEECIEELDRLKSHLEPLLDKYFSIKQLREWSVKEQNFNASMDQLHELVELCGPLGKKGKTLLIKWMIAYRKYIDPHEIEALARQLESDKEELFQISKNEGDGIQDQALYENYSTLISLL